MIITYIYSNCLADQIRAQVRCRNLVDAINRAGNHQASLLSFDAFVQNTPEAQRICAASDLLVIYRYLYGPALAAVQYWKARDKAVIVDFDQAINFLTKDMPGYGFWYQGLPPNECVAGLGHIEYPIDPPPIEQFKWGLGMVDAATVASTRLADDWSQFTRVYELPDYINTHHYPVSEHSHENEIWIGFGNEMECMHLDTIGLKSALENVCQARPQVRLLLCDWQEKPALNWNIPLSQVHTHSLYYFDEWVSLLLKLDIGLFPIIRDYDVRSSPNSLVEFMISKIPWIASEQPSYHRFAPYGQWVQNSSKAWENAILDMIDHLSQYKKRAAREPFLFALSQDISVNIDKILRVYDLILQKGNR